MRDLRELASIPESWRYEGRFWRETPFRWRRWLFNDPKWTHDHCRSCFACICNHRDRFPETDPGERGCFRHAWLAQRESPKEGVGIIYLWVCRNCFKRVRKEFGWTVEAAANPVPGSQE